MSIKCYRRMATPYASRKNPNFIQAIYLGRDIAEVKSQVILGDPFDTRKVQDVAIVSFSELKSLCQAAGVEMIDSENEYGEVS